MLALFLLSVVAIILAVDLVVGAIYMLMDDTPAAPGLAGVPREVFIAGAVVTIAIIAVVSIFNIVGLAGGGAKVARMLGGRKVAPDTRDALERRFLNIVEEMAIASGVRVPEAWSWTARGASTPSLPAGRSRARWSP